MIPRGQFKPNVENRRLFTPQKKDALQTEHVRSMYRHLRSPAALFHACLCFRVTTKMDYLANLSLLFQETCLLDELVLKCTKGRFCKYCMSAVVEFSIQVDI